MEMNIAWSIGSLMLLTAFGLAIAAFVMVLDINDHYTKPSFSVAHDYDSRVATNDRLSSSLAQKVPGKLDAADHVLGVTLPSWVQPAFHADGTGLNGREFMRYDPTSGNLTLNFAVKEPDDRNVQYQDLDIKLTSPYLSVGKVTSSLIVHSSHRTQKETDADLNEFAKVDFNADTDTVTIEPLHLNKEQQFLALDGDNDAKPRLIKADQDTQVPGVTHAYYNFYTLTLKGIHLM